MPKPIKKRVQKKSAEKEVLTVYEICKNYYIENKRFVHLAVFAIIALVLLSFITINYFSSKSEKAHELLSEGYRLYSSRNNPKEKDSLREALSKFKEAFDKNRSAETLYYIANTEYKLGKYDEAIRSLNKIVKEFKDNKEILSLAYLKKATILLKQDKKEDALRVLNELYSSDTRYLKDVALYEEARILEDLGKKEDAKKKYEELVKKYPASPYKATAEAKIKPPENKENKGKKKENTKEEKKGKESPKNK